MRNPFKRRVEIVEKVIQPPRQPRKYIIVRGDLIPGLQAAQASHASDYLTAADPLILFQHPTTTILSVKDLDQLWKFYHRHRSQGHIPGTPDAFMYREPDLKYEATAFACYSKGSEFKDLPLALSGYVPNPEDA